MGAGARGGGGAGNTDTARRLCLPATWCGLRLRVAWDNLLHSVTGRCLQHRTATFAGVQECRAGGWRVTGGGWREVGGS